MRGIVWLASYPKSGNTWFRAFLTALLNEGEGAIDINQMRFATNISSRRVFDSVLGWESADLPREKVFKLGLAVQEHLAGLGRTFFKTHTAFTHPQNSMPLVSPAATHCSIYLIRNPLDVVVSLANHNGEKIDVMVNGLNSLKACLASTGGRLQLPQPMGDWSWHVRSWADSPQCHVLRYEDMLAIREKAFGEACRFAGLHYDSARIASALERSRFEVLQQQEKAKGFREKPGKSSHFFRHGRSGTWRDVLSCEHTKTIIDAHRQMMLRFGYIDEAGNPLV